MCLKIADDLDLFKHTGVQGSTPTSIDALAAATSAEPALLKRIVRYLAARKVLIDDAEAPGLYHATHTSEALATREGSSGIRYAYNVALPAILEAPKFLKNSGYRTPTDGRNGIFQQIHGLRDLEIFEYFQLPDNKHLAEDFNMLMKFTTSGRGAFWDVCDMGSLLRRRGSAASSTHLLVDIGGGTGTDAASFRAHYAQTPGTVELQELHGVIEATRAAAAGIGDVSLRVHDFFTPQPVQGSRFYFMGSILHDWPDADTKRILGHVTKAMEPGYSTLLLSEYVLPDTNCHPHLSAVDLTMMTHLGSRERSEGDWHDLLETAGLDIIKVHTIPSSLKSVLECELK